MMHTYFADVLLPLPLQGLFTYRIPQELNDSVGFGMRVVVPFGKSKLYSGLVLKVHENVPQQVNVKYVLDVIDEHSVVSERQIQLWQWIARYYMCSLGEVMAAALPLVTGLVTALMGRLWPVDRAILILVMFLCSVGLITLSDIAKSDITPRTQAFYALGGLLNLPWMLLTVVVFSRAKASNTVAANSLLMPMPVSLTLSS